MAPLTSIERVRNVLHHEPIDEVPCMDSIWGETYSAWIERGNIAEGEDVGETLGMDIRSGGWLNSCANLDFEPVVIEETEETILQLDGNGAKLRRHKLHASTPEHVDFTVKDREGWLEHAKPFLTDLDRRRIPFENYREARKRAAELERFFCWAGVAPFEQMHPVCGHEYMLMGMALDPDWVKDMAMTYADLTIRHQEVLFAEEGEPDGIFFYEDMGFKGKPFMSPAMYADILQPAHKKLFDFAHSRGLKVIVHSCGYVAPLAPGLVEAGMDCLQAMEVKAGMDLRELKQQFGDRLAYFGNMDVRTLISNDRAQIDAELEAKLPAALADDGGYVLMSDHSIPPEVEFETMQYFFQTGKAMSRKLLARNA
ncbi:MAG: uroporphyrinogen decarboxylase family protein [Planctomycetota bacterium]